MQVDTAEDLRAVLNATLESILLPRIAGARRIALIDAPGHPNVGDQAILLGELDFLRRHAPQASLTFYDVDTYTAAADADIERSDCILLHGGGNFGDLWPRNHDIRLRIIEKFRHKTTIQLPQSIHFSDEAVLARTADLIGRHRNFTLLTREQKSHEIARAHFSCECVMTPDMAFAMRPIVRLPPELDFLCLMRTDKEKIADHDSILAALAEISSSVGSADWLQEDATWTLWLDKKLRRQVKHRYRLAKPFVPMTMMVRERYARQRLADGITILSRGRAVVADRLHAHILSCLLGISNFVFDSYDGKVRSFYETWSCLYRPARFVESPHELADAVRDSGLAAELAREARQQ